MQAVIIRIGDAENEFTTGKVEHINEDCAWVSTQCENGRFSDSYGKIVKLIED